MTRREDAHEHGAHAAERVYVFWPTVPPPRPGETVRLDDGRHATVETANFDGLRLHRRKLVVVIDESTTDD